MNKKYLILIILFLVYSCSLNKNKQENDNNFEVINVKIEDNKEVESW